MTPPNVTTLFLTTDGDRHTVGLWEAQPYLEQVDSYPGNEYCAVLKGSVTLTDRAGQSRTFGIGDHFVMEAGWHGTWRVNEPFVKFLVLSEPHHNPGAGS
jgi:uncharacterized protein